VKLIALRKEIQHKNLEIKRVQVSSVPEPSVIAVAKL
jgi:hypothetical protein